LSQRVLVTGGSGFIGRRLVQVLREQGVEVHAPGRSLLDVADGQFPDVHVDCVIHLAGRTFVPASWDEPADFYRVNVQGTVKVLDYCRCSKANLIYVSGYCYGLPETLPIPEDAPLRPNNPYAFSKCSAEMACRFFAEYMQTAVTILRPFNIYGPGQGSDFLVPSIVTQAIDPATTAVTVQDDTPRRDYVHLDDVVSAIDAIRRHPKPGATFNVGSGRSYSVAEVAELACRAAGVRKPVESRGQRRINDIPDVIADIAAIKSAVGWTPTIDLLDGLRGMITGSGHPRA
jgi:nucleoside-diphosphate-sugar epimerase